MNSQKIPKEDWISKKIEIRDTSNKGKGMFAIQKIKKGEKVLNWGGLYVNKQEAKKAEKAGKLVLQWDDDLFSVETRGEDIGYFINHSCDSNTWMSDAFTLIARRNIEIGEEITVDYGLFDADEEHISSWECQCESSICRKKITGKDWRLPELQERYRDHFSPLNNKRINRFNE